MKVSANMLYGFLSGFIIIRGVEKKCPDGGRGMTNQKAIGELSALMTRQPDYAVALDKAISALQAQEAKTQLSAEGTTSDLISRQAAIALADSLKDDLPDDERIADTVMAHNEGILEYQTKLSLLPSAQPELSDAVYQLWKRAYEAGERSTQPEIVRCKDCKYRGGLSGFYCDIVEKAVGVDSFCSRAERRTDA